jgi:hypothetical protein
MIKRLVRQMRDGRFSVRGDGALSVPSVDLGQLAANDIIGRIVLTIRPRIKDLRPPLPPRATSKTIQTGGPLYRKKS